MDTVLYIHGKDGSASESVHYDRLFPDCHVSGLDYKSFSPWETGIEIHTAVADLKKRYENISIIANSIGAFFCMNADIESLVQRAYFISPVVNMEKLICSMMKQACITEDELERKKIIPTDFGEDLSWEYLCYVRNHPVKWTVPTAILYGENDTLTSPKTISRFAGMSGATLTVMKNGEHWFHTEEQMKFLDEWIVNSRKNKDSYISLPFQAK